MRKKLALAFLAAAILSAIAGVLIACNETPTAVAVRTFERAQRMDVVCLHVLRYAPDGTASAVSPIEPVPQERCNPVASGVNGGALENQLFALVTQSTRGELAVVNLSAGYLQDLSRATPGINFVPVGALPTDVAVTPDGNIAFVGSAEANKPAIYGVSTRRVLGDQFGFPADPEGPVGLPSWPVCSLPQNPGAMAVVARRPNANANAADGGADGGVDANVQYELVVVLNGDQRSTPKIVTIDARPFLRRIAGVQHDDAGKPTDWWGDGQTYGEGQLEPCVYTSAIEISGQGQIPKSFTPGPTWPDGVPYVDGGVDLSCPQAAAPSSCPATCVDGGAVPPDAGAIDLALGPLDPTRLAAAALDDQFLYVADANLPLIHVLDLSVPGQPQELAPFLATSTADPTRVVAITSVAVSPPTRDYKRFLYAVDKYDGSIIVYDVTDPKTALRTPMRRPHPELDPFQPEDRIFLGGPAVAVSFVRHDFPLARVRGVPVPNARSGLLCNPNPNLTAFTKDAKVAVPPGDAPYGAFYRNDNGTDPDAPLGPKRLRGIFGFATLANGNIIAIDVDDWDAPCRRPQLLTTDPGAGDGDAGALAKPEPGGAAGDIDPYHAPKTDPGATSEEITFPIIQPHRVRSAASFRIDSEIGNATPRINGVPQGTQPSIASVPFSGPDAKLTSLPLPANATPAQATLANNGADGLQVDPQALGVEFSLEVPQIQRDEDWHITYEGNLPGFDGISAAVTTPDNYASLVLTQPDGRFCAKGIEDWDVGRDRAARVTAELHQNLIRVPGEPKAGAVPEDEVPFDRTIADYVQLTEDLLDPGDPYWADTDDPGQCWDPSLNTAAKKYDVCAKTFGNVDDPTTVPTTRDFPILEAYSDHLVLGTYAPKANGARDIVYKDATYNAPRLKLMRCCFHHQVRFHVRTGGLWSAIGTNTSGQFDVGFLTNVISGSGGRCVPSCEPRKALLNGRAPPIPTLTTDQKPGFSKTAPGRNSALAMRNPFFAIWMADGLLNDRPPIRDTQWSIPVRGSFVPLSINLAAATVAVSPQSMRFIETLGQLAVVDAQSQGLVLIDLSAVAIAHNPYF
jgi:hypothetical protein